MCSSQSHILTQGIAKNKTYNGNYYKSHTTENDAESSLTITISSQSVSLATCAYICAICIMSNLIVFLRTVNATPHLVLSVSRIALTLFRSYISEFITVTLFVYDLSARLSSVRYLIIGTWNTIIVFIEMMVRVADTYI